MQKLDAFLLDTGYLSSFIYVETLDEGIGWLALNTASIQRFLISHASARVISLQHSLDIRNLAFSCYFKIAIGSRFK